NLRKKVKWFSPNARHYYCVAVCEKHGFLKCKIRIRKAENGQIYVVKTSRFISPEDVEKLIERRDHARRMHCRSRRTSEKAPDKTGRLKGYIS
ncbi:MAG: DNA polymerase III, partial [Acetatifactor sp.]|nr:DNA polymerase III [Acetatifactor sp.]